MIYFLAVQQQFESKSTTEGPQLDLKNKSQVDLKNKSQVVLAPCILSSCVPLNRCSMQIILPDRFSRKREKKIFWFESQLRILFPFLIPLLRRCMYIQNEGLSSQFSAQFCDMLPREAVSFHNYRELSSAAVKSSVSTWLRNFLVRNALKDT